MTPKIKVEYAIVCDDIRQEISGKLIVIGLYTSNIGVPYYPFTTRLNLLIAVRSATGGSVTVDLRVVKKDGEIFEPKAPKTIDLPKDDTFLVSIIGIPFTFSEDTELDFQVRFNGGKHRSVCKIPVTKATS